MWRSNARALVRASSILRASSSISEVHATTLTLTSSSCARSTRWVFRVNPHFQNPRFFSQVSDTIDRNDEKESDSSGSDGNGDFGVGAFVDSNESELSPVAFGNGGENVSFESGELSGLFGDGAEEKDVSGKDPIFVSPETGESSLPFADVVENANVDDANSDVQAVQVDAQQVENVLSILQSSLGKPVESSLAELDLALSEEFVVRILETPLVLGVNLVEFFRWALKQQDFFVSTRALNCLVHAIGVSCRKKDVYALWDLIKDIGDKERGLITTDILNDLISMFWKLGKGKAALEAFNKFEDLGCTPSADTHYLTIEALFSRSMLDDAWSVCEKLLQTGNLPCDEKIGKIITGLCKGRRAKDAHLVYLMTKEKEKRPPKSTLIFLISKLCGDDATAHIALELLEDFSEKSRKYAIKSFSNVLRALSRVGKAEEAKKLLTKMIELGPPPGNAAFNSVIGALSKTGDMEEAIALKNLMVSRGLRPDVFTYTVIMSGYAKGGQMDDVYKIFSEAKKVHSKLSQVTYHILIRGYCKLEEFEKALQCLREMKEDGVQPNHDEYNKLIQSLCLKALDWQTAEVLVEEMKQEGLHLNGITHSLIKAVKDLENEALQSQGASVEA
ncbi:small ribosomal subunit protein mS80 (rPPR6)-like [Aristolochia californica]|uniref:small ribosomal subunit protein mS80 (rPPR6)-like n=1 Tax=Aristolochia californica TaxID=171875 RepID=UPI0035D969E7